MNKIKTALKSPLLYVGIAIGAVLILAVPALAKIFKPVADVIPGSKSKTSTAA